MHKRTLLTFTICFTLTLIAAFGLATPPATAQIGNPAATQTARGLSIGATQTAFRSNNAVATATANVVKVRGTTTAFANSLKATSTAYKQQLSSTLTAVKGTLTNDQVAQQAIYSYAQQVLGINVSIVAAGSMSNAIIRDQAHIDESKQAQAQVSNLAVKTYGATLKSGAATVSYGSGTVSGDVTVDVQDISLGIYSLGVTYSGALSADRALELILQTYPALRGRAFVPVQTTTGYAWHAKSSVSVMDTKTKLPKVTSESAIVYIFIGQNNRASVTATIGRGQFAPVIAVPPALP
jgi:hypothetical protein